MAELKETARQYYIPDNYIEEGRVFQGRIRLRNLIEGIVMGLISASVGIVAVLGRFGASAQANTPESRTKASRKAKKRFIFFSFSDLFGEAILPLFSCLAVHFR